LQALVSASVGRPVTIRRDLTLSDSTKFTDETADLMRKTGVLLAIVSPAYAASELCKRERESLPRIRAGQRKSRAQQLPARD
jgi:hypothetical protein